MKVAANWGIRLGVALSVWTLVVHALGCTLLLSLALSLPLVFVLRRRTSARAVQSAPR